MRVVVTGGAGFLGSHLCARLIDDGHEVVCIDNFLTGTPRNVEHLIGRSGFVVVAYNVTDYLHVGGDVGAVFHFASPASPHDYMKFGIQTLKVGALGTHKALGLAKAKDARFVLASTSEVYGDPQVHPQPEDYWGHVNPIGPRGVYDEGKRFAEALTMAYHRTHGLDTKIVRIFNTFGPYMRFDDGRAVPEFMTAALQGRPLVVHGDGSQTRSLCYVDDLIDGIVQLAESDHHGPMNIGNPEEVSVLELAQLIAKITNSTSEITFGPRPVDDPNVRRPDISLARQVLGWEPKVRLEDGLRRTAEWFAKELQT
ncbi:MAG TPA: UDP-glucuronic acid decarboxylase family protein [Actinomycetota bacterium]|jgi:dTDP-glucose 4,6-dehydratase|nr:UDP-glucuronic acid decarboxylase family protein [Actinomycetota bacterium]